VLNHGHWLLNIVRFSSRRVFERRTVRTSRPDSSALYFNTTRDIFGFSRRLLVGILGFLRQVADPQGLRAPLSALPTTRSTTS
jgi:hypothetical protein